MVLVRTICRSQLKNSRLRPWNLLIPLATSIIDSWRMSDASNFRVVASGVS